ncbi:hypothetical protein BDW74DRAFT_31303 [Aspergillus multicolor]|uniref:uncharacterized protein n=1 Tax=Aspergillus multicolor TaxID=41759 RepID=UPI003CCD4D27
MRLSISLAFTFPWRSSDPSTSSILTTSGSLLSLTCSINHPIHQSWSQSGSYSSLHHKQRCAGQKSNSFCN